MTTRYRPEIDGLRAVAVIPVIFYHAGASFVPGGFAGVDIFFVISGYLITSILLADLNRGRFSLIDFYVRRARRILPALFFLVAVSAVIGWWLLVPDDYKNFGQSVVATTLFSSNFLFWWETGYFDVPIFAKPLLHTWSLAVEEQFYLLFPLYLWALHALGRRPLVFTTALICVISFTGYIICSLYAPETAFFLAPFRFWELSLGALIALNPGRVPSTQQMAAGVSLSGVVSIATSLFLLGNETAGQTASVMLAAFGTAAFIWGNSAHITRPGRLLSRMAPIFVGKISYSLYLWHFPLLAFANYLYVDGLTTSQTTAVLAFTAMIATFSWRFIEQPARRSRFGLSGTRQVFLAAVSGSVLLAAFGGALHYANGMQTRFTDTERRSISGARDYNIDRDICEATSPREIYEEPFCPIGDANSGPQFVLWGDSHADALRAAVELGAQEYGISGIYAGSYGCVPTLNRYPSAQRDCAGVNEAILRYISANSEMRTVILAGRWAIWADTERLANDLETIVASLVDAGKTVWIVTQIPEPGVPVPRALYIKERFGLDSSLGALNVALFEAQQSTFMNRLAQLRDEYGIELLYPYRQLCAEAHCIVEQNGTPLYFDSEHLSNSGSRYLAPMFLPVFAGLGVRK